jgi:hypothetical protein
MRDYAKIGPKAWHGETFKKLRKGPSEGLLVALYLMSSPSSNMLGLYPQPMLYMAHETGLGMEGASKGLRSCIAAGFCSYDEASEVVWVHEMAKYQVAEELKPADKRCAGIQKDYDSLPNNPFLGPFFERYAAAFHMTRARAFDPAQPDLLGEALGSPLQAPPKPRTGTGARTGSLSLAPSPQIEPPKPPDDFTGLNAEVFNGKTLACLAEGFTLPAEWGLDAEKLGFAPSKVAFEAERFRQYWASGAGKGKRRTVRGWRQAWSNWLGKAAERNQR